MNEYLVWYRKYPNSPDIVLAASRCYESGREAALQLHFVLKHWEKISSYQIGVTRIPINKVVLDIQDRKFPTRWVVVENGREIPEED